MFPVAGCLLVRRSARGLVEMHGGSLTAESAGIGRGARFTIRLPGAQRISAAAR
jgi:signal transduction histidine kinase